MDRDWLSGQESRPGMSQETPRPDGSNMHAYNFTGWRVSRRHSLLHEHLLSIRILIMNDLIMNELTHDDIFGNHES